MSGGALIKFTQGVHNPPAGEALAGDAGAAVTCTNDDNTDIASWTWQIVDAPPGSIVPIGTFSTSSSGTFTPDAGLEGVGYLVKLTTVDDDGVVASDTRAVVIENSYGRAIPPFSAEADAMNVGGQERGWAAETLEAYLSVIDRLGDVGGSAPSDGDVLAWSNANSRYEPTAASSGIVWADDLAGSTDTDQWVAAISGNGGGGGTVLLKAIAFVFTLASTTAGMSQQTQTSDVATQDMTFAPQQAFASATAGNRKPADLIASFGSPTNGGTTYAQTLWKRGSNVHARIDTEFGVATFGGATGPGNTAVHLGPLTGDETNYAGVWMLASGVTRTSSNAVLESNGISLIVNSPNAGASIRFLHGAATQSAQFNPSTDLQLNVPNIDWDETQNPPALTQFIRTSDLPTHYMRIRPQAPYASATGTNRLPGHLHVDIAAHDGGIGHNGGLEVQINSFSVVNMGEYSDSGTTYGAIWFASNAISPSSSNWAFLGSISDSYLNAPSSTIYFGVSGSYYMAMQSSQFVMGVGYSTPNFTFDFSDTAIFHFTERNTTNEILVNPKTSDVTPVDFYIVPQGPFASATGTNRDPADVIINSPAPAGGSTSKYGGVQYQRNGTTLIRAGMYQGGSTYGAIWFQDGGTPGGSNYGFLGNAADTQLNAPSGTLYMLVGNASGFAMSSSLLRLGGSFGSPQYKWDLTAAAAFHFAIDATSAQIIYDPKTTDVATVPLIIAEQAAFATATGANRTPGGIQFLLTDPTNSGTTYSSVHLKRNSTIYASIESQYGIVTAGETTTNYYAAMGPLLTAGNANAGLWLLPGSTAPSTTNPAIYQDSTVLWMNGRTATHKIQMSVAGGATFFTWDNNNDTMTGSLNFWKWSQGMATPTITQVIKTSGSGVDMLIEAQTAQQSGDTDGGFVNISGGASHGTGLDGGVRLKMNTDTPMVELTEVVNGSHVLALVLGTTLTSTNMPSGTGNMVIFIADCQTPPGLNTDPVGGGILYSESGALTWHGTSGTVTVLGAAEPHCPRCGSDFAVQWTNIRYGGCLSICMKCLVGALDRHGVHPDEYAIKVPEAA